MKFFLMILVLPFFCVHPVLAGETPAAAPPSFYGFSCTEDCSGHKAGYEWAERKNIRREEDCRGRSRSFVEGCIARAREQEQTSENENENANAPIIPSSPPETD